LVGPDGLEPLGCVRKFQAVRWANATTATVATGEEQAPGWPMIDWPSPRVSRGSSAQKGFRVAGAGEDRADVQLKRNGEAE